MQVGARETPRPFHCEGPDFRVSDAQGQAWRQLSGVKMEARRPSYKSAVELPGAAAVSLLRVLGLGREGELRVWIPTDWI